MGGISSDQYAIVSLKAFYYGSFLGEEQRNPNEKKSCLPFIFSSDLTKMIYEETRKEG
jgi:hypothetical protein